jgi:sugar-specific transcriptional regulator TrmB
MDVNNLTEIGLTESQARAYLAIIEAGEISPSELASKINEKRTNGYMVLDKLEQLGLVIKSSNSTKLKYKPTNPLALETLILNKKKQLADVETRMRATLPKLVSYFYNFTEKPGIRLLEGVEGLKEVYTDTLRTKKPITFLRSPVEVDFLGQEFYDKYRLKRAKLGISTEAYTQSISKENDEFRSSDDKQLLINRHLISQNSYSEPVEINVYGDKTALIAFGNQPMGVIIQNDKISNAILKLINSLD